MYIYWFSSESGYRCRRRRQCWQCGHHSTTTRMTYRQWAPSSQSDVTDLLVAWLSGSVLVSINKVTLHWAS